MKIPTKVLLASTAALSIGLSALTPSLVASASTASITAQQSSPKPAATASVLVHLAQIPKTYKVITNELTGESVEFGAVMMEVSYPNTIKVTSHLDPDFAGYEAEYTALTGAAKTAAASIGGKGDIIFRVEGRYNTYVVS
ncbi:hypothetical protein [Lacticaseibacillus kribbianus]|uniref:hypothetical protein n=1 Tax=Lacticaseibacillus kribbianus TaxID=2926292 RepID=UPI001CD7CD5D|nr:hypothetical protein [Lacticaseibacillus kribbianus]